MHWTPIVGRGEEISGEVRGKWKNLSFLVQSLSNSQTFEKKQKEMGVDWPASKPVASS